MVNANVSMDVSGWLNDLHRELDALIIDMFQLCEAVEEKRYSGDAVHQAGVLSVMIPDAETLGETTPQRAARNTFMGAMSKLSTFLDRLIASGKLAEAGIPITHDLVGEVLSMLESSWSARWQKWHETLG